MTGQRVYFAHAKGGGPIKIGYTADLKNRMKAIGAWFVPGAEVITGMYTSSRLTVTRASLISVGEMVRIQATEPA